MENCRKELLGYAKRCEYLSSPIFLTRNEAPVNRTYVSASIRSICEGARVLREKGNPRCLKRLYQATKGRIEDNISLLVEQAMDRLLERSSRLLGHSFASNHPSFLASTSLCGHYDLHDI